MNKPEHVEAIFYYSENVPQLLSDAVAFYTAIAPAGAISAGSLAGPGSAYVGIAAASITAAMAHVASGRTAESAVATRAKGTATARDLALAAVLTDIHNFVALVQIVVNNAPNAETAKAIVAACGLHTRKETPRTKAGFNVKNDPTTAGLVDFIFTAAPDEVRASYEVQISIDNINWTTIKVSPSSSSKYAHKMPSGTKLYFRGRIALSDNKGGAQAWQTPPAVYIYVL